MTCIQMFMYSEWNQRRSLGGSLEPLENVAYETQVEISKEVLGVISLRLWGTDDDVRRYPSTCAPDRDDFDLVGGAAYFADDDELIA